MFQSLSLCDWVPAQTHDQLLLYTVSTVPRAHALSRAGHPRRKQAWRFPLPYFFYNTLLKVASAPYHLLCLGCCDEDAVFAHLHGFPWISRILRHELPKKGVKKSDIKPSKKLFTSLLKVGLLQFMPTLCYVCGALDHSYVILWMCSILLLSRCPQPWWLVPSHSLATIAL